METFAQHTLAILRRHRLAHEIPDAVPEAMLVRLPPHVDLVGVRPGQILIRVHRYVIVFRIVGRPRLEVLGWLAFKIEIGQTKPVIIDNDSQASLDKAGSTICLMIQGR